MTVQELITQLTHLTQPQKAQKIGVQLGGGQWTEITDIDTTLLINKGNTSVITLLPTDA